MELSLENIPRYYTLIAEMMSCWVFFSLFKQKQSMVKIILYTIVVVGLEWFYLQVSESIQIWFWPIHMTILFSIMFLYMKLVINWPGMPVFYYTTKTFLVAEFIASFEWQMILINNIESELREYRPYFQTGNDVLNALLDSRRTLWNNNQVTITAVADGKMLEFMNVADICSMIGNALDNALESVCLIEDVDKRLIHIEIAGQRNFVMVVVENTCERRVTFENGLPEKQF